jgi:membrane protein
VLLTLGARTVRDTFEDRVPKLAAEVAFFTLLALPPAMLAVLGSVGFLAEAFGPEMRAEIESRVLDLARTFLTSSTVNEVVAPAVRTLLREGRADVVSVGIVLAVWSASRATEAAIDTMRIAYDLERFRPSWKRRLVAFVLTMGLIIALVVLMPTLVAGPRLGARLVEPLGLSGTVEAAWRLLYWPVLGVLGTGLLATFYHLALPRRTPWRRELPGAALALLTWILGSLAVRVYARWILESGSTYGSLSAPIVILLWLYVTGLAVLLGAELNSEIDKLWLPARRADARIGPPLHREGRPSEVFIVTY